MPKRKADNVTEAAQETPLEGAEQASHIEQIPTDASEGAESAETEILQHNVDNVTEAVQDATREDAEQVSRIMQISTDAGEHAARAGTEILQRNVETIQDALQSSAEIAARVAERSADQFGRVFGISVDEAHKAAQKSSDNLDVIIESSSVFAGVTQSISREWVNFIRERMEQNFNRFETLLRCRTPQDLAAVQSEFLRDNLESFLQCARRIAETSMQMADEATKRTAEAVERARAA
ncbi:MAG: phasin family protein [Rhodoplanes sp.]